MKVDVRSDDHQINKALQRAWDNRRCIGDVLAQELARRLADDAGPLQDFAETGAISAELQAMLAAAREDSRHVQGIWIAALEQYCRDRGQRGPVVDWTKESHQ